MVHLLLVKGTCIEPGKRFTHTLREGDVPAIWPLIADCRLPPAEWRGASPV